MRFQILTFVAAALSVVSAQAPAASPSPNSTPFLAAAQVEEKIDSTADSAGKALGNVQLLRTGANIYLVVPAVLSSFRQLTDKIVSNALDLNLLPPTQYAPADQVDICTSYKQLTSINKQIVKAFFDQARLTTGTEFHGPIHSILRVFEGGAQKFHNGLIKLIPDCRDTAQADFDKLAQIIRLAIVAL